MEKDSIVKIGSINVKVKLIKYPIIILVIFGVFIFLTFLSCAIVQGNYSKGFDNYNNHLNQVRRYEDLENRILNLKRYGYLVQKTGSVTYKKTYNLYRIDLNIGEKKRMLITAGTHGNEIAGVHAVVSFLESRESITLFKNHAVTIIPCINPWGYEHHSRYTHNGIDINRDFSGSNTSTEEAKIHIKALEKDKFDKVLDLHESHSAGHYFFTYNSKTYEYLRKFIVTNTNKYIFEDKYKVAGNKVNNGILEINGFIVSLLMMADRASLPHKYSGNDRIVITVETAITKNTSERIAFHQDVIRYILTK